MYNAITDVPGIRVGHYTDLKAITGCTVILCPEEAVAGVDVRGAAPGTRDTDLLDPVNAVEKVHGILLSGGSAYGLDAVGGVLRYLEEKGVGYLMEGIRVPIVPAAVLFDIGIGNGRVRPGNKEGYQACVNAVSGPVEEGCVGAGTGAMIGQLQGNGRATKSGLGTASLKIYGDVIVGAIFAVNCLGDVFDPATGRILAGMRNEDGRGFADTIDLIKKGYTYMKKPGENTVIGCLATNARLTKAEATRVAMMAHDGLARAINPAHTMMDGDTIFSLSTGNIKCDLTTVGAIAAEVTRMAIVSAVRHATSLGSVPSLKDIPTK